MLRRRQAAFLGLLTNSKLAQLSPRQLSSPSSTGGLVIIVESTVLQVAAKARTAFGVKLFRLMLFGRSFELFLSEQLGGM